MSIRTYVPLSLVMLLAGCTTTQSNDITTNATFDTTTTALTNVTTSEPDGNNDLPPLEPLVPGTEAFVGSWQSPCLIPDEASDYAEKHFFTFSADGTAIHKRETFYKKSCTGPDDTLVDNYTYVIPEPGLLNLTDVDAGQTIYDIYKFDQFTLSFGHGFRNTLSYPETVGASASDRISTINSYIIYSKIQ